MAKYGSKRAVKQIPSNLIAKELLIAQQGNIAKPNPDVTLIQNEITRRLNSYSRAHKKIQGLIKK